MAPDTGQGLLSKSHRDILDIIDSLRSSGISQYIELPQIVVCGDQSAGKSSVLEAISGLSFPTKDALCTRFATELILRRCKKGESSVKFSIIPGPDRGAAAGKKLRKFKYDTDGQGETNLGHVVDSAASMMASVQGASSAVFFKDILRVEMSSPDQPHLTLVDLPGLFLAGNKDQSIEDAELVKSLVKSYMEQPRSIILAVLSAKSEFNLQQVTELTRQVDPDGNRTLGLITKPDTLDVGSDNETAYLNLAQNKDVRFRLGWHVIKNRSFKMRDATKAQRDASEKAFLSSGVWASLSSSQLGIRALVERLSRVLHDHNVAQLPRVIDEIKAGIDDCEKELEKLGESRSTLPEQRRYLLRISGAFTSLVSEAVDGTYATKGFFEDLASDKGYEKRLRARVQNLSSDFARGIRIRGHTYTILDDSSVNDDSDLEEEDHEQGRTKRRKQNDGTAAPDNAVQGPEVLKHQDMVDKVKTMMSRTRGRELPGTFNPLLTSQLFSSQCLPWTRISQEYIDKSISASRSVLRAAIKFASGRSTADSLIRGIIAPEFDSLAISVRAKLDEILLPHTHGHPITYNHYLTTNLQKVQNRRLEKKLKDALASYTASSEARISPMPWNSSVPSGGQTPVIDQTALLGNLMKAVKVDMETYAATALIDTMKAYYKVAMKRFIDDVSVLVVEMHLMKRLPELFSPDVVCGLDDYKISSLVGESAETTEHRIMLNKKLTTLQECEAKLDRVRRGVASIDDSSTSF